MSLISDLPSDDFPFIHTKINKFRVDYEEFVGADTTFSSYFRDTVLGRVGD